MSTPICNAMLQSVAENVHRPTKDVLSNIAKLLANPGLLLFNILQFITEHFFFSLNISIGKNLELSSPVTLEATKNRRPGDKACWE